MSTTLPSWYTELAPEVQTEISAFLQAKGRELARLQHKLDDQARIIENRNADITRLEGEVARLEADLATRPQRPRPVAEMQEELELWYGLAGLILFRLRAIGEKFSVEPEEDHHV
jgi:predicted nuclease with TOPRIM domain